MKKQITLFITSFVMTLLSITAFKANNVWILILAPLTVLSYFAYRNKYSALSCYIISLVTGLSVFVSVIIQSLYISNEKINSLMDMYDFTASLILIVYFCIGLSIEGRESNDRIERNNHDNTQIIVDLGGYSEGDYTFPTQKELNAIKN